MFTTTSLSDLNYFDNWSASFHIKFEEFKNLVRMTPSIAIDRIRSQLELSKLVTGTFIIAGNQKNEVSFGSTIINEAIAIVQGNKPFNSNKPTLLVALLYILDLCLNKQKLIEKQQQLQQELSSLGKLLERI